MPRARRSSPSEIDNLLSLADAAVTRAHEDAERTDSWHEHNGHMLAGIMELLHVQIRLLGEIASRYA